MKKVICFDLDGVIAKYKKWRGFDVIGKPNHKVIKAMKKLKDEGYYITIWTTRSDTPKLRKWLKNNKVPYDSLNSNSHNPPCTSQKPIYHCIIDDRAIRYTNQSTLDLIKEIKELIESLEEL